jgi:hypothetical protein
LDEFWLREPEMTSGRMSRMWVVDWRSSGAILPASRRGSLCSTRRFTAWCLPTTRICMS